LIVKFRREIGIETKAEEYCQKLEILQKLYRLGIALCFTAAFWVSLHTSALHVGYNNMLPTESGRMRNFCQEAFLEQKNLGCD
jgi:hypothetical protein